MRAQRTIDIHIVFLALFLAGCATTPVREREIASLCDLSDGLLLTREELTQEIGLLVEHDVVMEALGRPDESFDGSWFCTWHGDQHIDGVARRARYEGLEFEFVRLDGRPTFLLQEVELASSAYSVACNIRVGDSADSVRTKLGSPHIETTDGDTGHQILKYVIPPGDSRLHFVVSGDTIMRIRARTWCSIQANPSIQRTAGWRAAAH